jgi:hypothetical protein
MWNYQCETVSAYAYFGHYNTLTSYKVLKPWFLNVRSETTRWSNLAFRIMNSRTKPQIISRVPLDVFVR